MIRGWCSPQQNAAPEFFWPLAPRLQKCKAKKLVLSAYEKEKRDIAAGILPATPPKPEKKKKKPNKKAEGHSGNKSEPKKKRKAVSKDNSGNEKKTKSGQRISKVDKESIGLALAKGVIKVRIGTIVYASVYSS